MITADELLASPVNLLAHLNKLSPSSAIRDEKLRAERAEELARAPAPPSFKLTPASALAWVESGFERLH